MEAIDPNPVQQASCDTIIDKVHQTSERHSPPVMIGIGRIIACFDLLQEVFQLDFIHVRVSDQASLVKQVKGEHGQSAALGGVSKAKDVKGPVVLSILQT